MGYARSAVPVTLKPLLCRALESGRVPEGNVHVLPLLLPAPPKDALLNYWKGSFRPGAVRATSPAASAIDALGGHRALLRSEPGGAVLAGIESFAPTLTSWTDADPRNRRSGAKTLLLLCSVRWQWWYTQGREDTQCMLTGSWTRG